MAARTAPTAGARTLIRVGRYDSVSTAAVSPASRPSRGSATAMRSIAEPPSPALTGHPWQTTRSRGGRADAPSVPLPFLARGATTEPRRKIDDRTRVDFARGIDDHDPAPGHIALDRAGRRSYRSIMNRARGRRASRSTRRPVSHFLYSLFHVEHRGSGSRRLTVSRGTMRFRPTTQAPVDNVRISSSKPGSDSDDSCLPQVGRVVAAALPRMSDSDRAVPMVDNVVRKSNNAVLKVDSYRV